MYAGKAILVGRYFLPIRGLCAATHYAEIRLCRFIDYSNYPLF